MKKTFFPILLASILFISCSTLGIGNKQSMLCNMGKDGDIIISSKPEFVDADYKNRIDRINICYSENEISGCVEGFFSKLLGSIAVKHINIQNYSLDYFQPKNGLMLFSTVNAKDYYSILNSGSDYIDEVDVSRILESDFAVYSKNPLSLYPNLEKMLILVVDDICTAEFKAADSEKAKGLFSAIKSSYVSYLTKNMIPVDYKELGKDFVLLDNIIYINNLPYNGYIQNFVEEFLYYGR